MVNFYPQAIAQVLPALPRYFSVPKILFEIITWLAVLL